MSTVNPYSSLDPEQSSKKEEPKPQVPEKHVEPPHHEKHHDPPKKAFEGHKNPAHPGNDEEQKVEKDKVEHHKHPHEGVKPKGVPAEPHPMDRKSGTGRGKEVSKGGAGRHSWGTVQDELKREGQYEDLEEDEYVSNENPEKLPENLMTLEEKKHKSIAEKDNKGPQPPVLGSHSESLGFKTEEEQAQEKKNEHQEHHEKIDIDEKNFPKLG